MLQGWMLKFAIGGSLVFPLLGFPTVGAAETASTAPEAGALKGRVTDVRGAPLAGAEVVADNQFFYNANAIVRSGTDGGYRIDVSGLTGTYHASAQIRRSYNGKTYVFALEPDDDAPFAGTVGAVRNFTWRLTGAYGDGRSHGSKVIYYFATYEDPENPEGIISNENVDLTLTPVGPLVDGGEGEPVTARGQNTPDGFGLSDVAVGRYAIAARYAEEGRPPRPLLIRVRSKGVYGPSATADFETVMPGLYRIELEVKFPGAQ